MINTVEDIRADVEAHGWTHWRVSESTRRNNFYRIEARATKRWADGVLTTLQGSPRLVWGLMWKLESND